MLQTATRWRFLAGVGFAILLLPYFYNLDWIGVYGPDEPRYASIGREMARTGDIVTPQLWGQPWFEKPPLLYWMVATGFRLGLPNELAPRIPVALLSLAFLIAFAWIVRNEFGPLAAGYSTAILATAGGWMALSEIAVTDIPLAATFGAAILFALPWLRTGNRRSLNAAAICLGLAILAKSAPPLLLALPLLWFGRDRWRDLVRPAPMLLFLLVVLPWHIACYLRNGPIFLYTLFWQHQFQRFISPSLQHVQPWWFYFPLLPLGLFPWTPVLILLVRRELYDDRRVQFLLATALWGLAFFSASINKLPTYLLPLLPPLAIVAGVALSRAQLAGRVVVILSALACCAFPILVMKFPAGMSRNPQAAAPPMPLVLATASLVILAIVCFVRHRPTAVALVGLLACTGYLWIKIVDGPFVDQAATARPVWRELQPVRARVCLESMPRDWRYGLNFYSATPLPDCGPDPQTGPFLDYQDHRVLLHLP